MCWCQRPTTDVVTFPTYWNNQVIMSPQMYWFCTQVGRGEFSGAFAPRSKRSRSTASLNIKRNSSRSTWNFASNTSSNEKRTRSDQRQPLKNLLLSWPQRRYLFRQGHDETTRLCYDEIELLVSDHFCGEVWVEFFREGDLILEASKLWQSSIHAIKCHIYVGEHFRTPPSSFCLSCWGMSQSRHTVSSFFHHLFSALVGVCHSTSYLCYSIRSQILIRK